VLGSRDVIQLLLLVGAAVSLRFLKYIYELPN
jgi:hypothetical protein